MKLVFESIEEVLSFAKTISKAQQNTTNTSQNQVSQKTQAKTQEAKATSSQASQKTQPTQQTQAKATKENQVSKNNSQNTVSQAQFQSHKVDYQPGASIENLTSSCFNPIR